MKITNTIKEYLEEKKLVNKIDATELQIRICKIKVRDILKISRDELAIGNDDNEYQDTKDVENLQEYISLLEDDLKYDIKRLDSLEHFNSNEL